MPATLESPPPAAHLLTRRRSFARRLLISIARFLLVALISALLGGGWYLAKKGFGRQWRTLVVEELRKHGVEASVRRLTLDPFRGLVAQDVRIFDYKNREKTLAFISEVSLDINYAALLHHQPFLNALDVRNGRLSLPLAGNKEAEEKAQLKNFHAHIYFPPEQIYVSQAEGVFCGVRISATGQLIKREDYRPSPALSEEEWQKRLLILERVVAELQKFSFSSEPSIQIRFRGNLADMENGRVEATLRGERVHRQNYEWRDLFANAEFANQRLTLNQCEWKDAAGMFSARGSWSRQKNDFNFQARSDLDVKSLLESLGFEKMLADTTFKTAPILEVSGTGNFGEGRPQLKIIGQIAAGDFTYRAVPFSQLRANFSWDGERTLVRDIRVQNQGGQLNAEVFDAPDDFRLDLDSTINPVGLRAFLATEVQKFLGEWEWPKPPEVHLAIRGQDHKPETWKGQGTVEVGRTRFRGVWMNSASTKIRFGDGAVTYDELRVTRDEGVATGAFTYDFKKHEVRISNIKSALQPAEMIFWIDPDLWKTVAPYKFRRAPAITANGVYQFAGGKNTRLDITVDAPNGMDYVFLGKTLPFDQISGKLVVSSNRLELIDLKSGLFSGVVRGNANISLAQNDPRYKADIIVKRIDFPRLTDLYFQYKTAQGQLHGTYDFTGLGSDARKMQGTGTVEITDGNVFAIPVFGPLSEILNGILPGSGYSVARKATATFTIADGVIHTDDFEAAGNFFSMLGNGDIHFLDDKLDFNLHMNMKGPGVLLAPMYKLFEYTGEGSLKKPDWHPKRF
jgi:AsmA-like C-terminal region